MKTGLSLITCYSILLIQQTVSALQTYNVLTRLKADRGERITCSDELLDSTSEVYERLNVDMCSALQHAINGHQAIQLSSCEVSKVVCDNQLPVVYTKVQLSSDYEISSQELHLAFSLDKLISETVVTIDFLQIQDYNECLDSHACHPNAVCKNTVGSYSCHCKPGYKPSKSLTYHQELSCDAECGGVTCGNGGVCATTNGQAICKCSKEFTGQSCSVLKKDVEWVWIVAATVTVATLITIPAIVCLCVYLKTRRKTTTPCYNKFGGL